MAIRTWIRKRFARKSRTIPKAAYRFRPCLEVLEERLTPSTYTVTDARDTAGSANDVTLRYAITQAIANQDQNAVINFSSALAGQTLTLSLTDSNNSYGPTAFVVNNAKIIIDASNAPGLIVNGNNALRPFAVTRTAALTLKNLTVQGGLAQGGAGGAGVGGGGGGGAGLGGAVYDDGGAFSAVGVTFLKNTAQGGQGGQSGGSKSGTGGGGGGLGVSGQSGSSGGAGGGSGGSGGSGGNGSSGGFGGGGGGFGISTSNNLFGNGGGGGGGMGGALFSNGGALTLLNDTFFSKTARGGGGGGGVPSAAPPGDGFGGAVFARNGTLTAQFDTFSSNTAAPGDIGPSSGRGSAGGTDVYVLSDGSGKQASAVLVDDILGQTSNTVSDFVANNINNDVSPNLSGSSNDLVRNNPSSGGLTGANILSGVDPQLLSLAKNGGPTKTMAILPGSPAYQKGIPINDIPTDQRGSVRPKFAPSLGAFDPLVPARTYTVTDARDTAGSANDVTLRYAITQAIANQDQNAVINFSSALAGQTLTLSLTDSNNSYGPTAFVVRNTAITIDGSNAPGLIVNGNNVLRPFAVTGTAALTLKNLTVQGGLAQGGAGGDGYFAGGGGGAGLGGAVYDDGGAFSAVGVTFLKNTAQGGQGGGNVNVTNNTPITGGGGGGGLGVAGGIGTTDAGGAGGGTGGKGGDPATGHKPSNAEAGGFGGGGGGGAVFGVGGDFGVGGAGGFGGGGGGGFAGAGRKGAGGFGGGAGAGSGFGGVGGGGGGMGGALFSNGGALTLINDTFTANTAQGGGGGRFNNPNSKTPAAPGSGFGGAVFTRNSSLTAQFDTFSSNTAAQGGTGVYVLSDGSGNKASASLVDDILGQTSANVSDFVANNINNGVAPNLSGSSNDLVRNNPSSGGLPAAAVVSIADPLLGALANNGGPTQTMAINSSSPAYQAGVTIVVPTIATDQRGYVRAMQGDPSLGAFDPLATPPAMSAPPSPPAFSAAPPVTTATQRSAGMVGLAVEEFQLVVDSVLAAIETNLHMPHAALDAALAQLRAAIADDPLLHTFPGQLGVLLGQIAALNVLGGS